MTRTAVIILFVFAIDLCTAQTDKPKLYDPTANAESQITDALALAKSTKRHVLIQVGGNWCSWCLKLHKLMRTDARIDSILKKDYIVVHLNYSKENKNLDVLKRHGFPQRFGFPVLLILDSNGNRLHTQDSGLLESGDHHDPEKVFTFLRNWSSHALDPSLYKE